MSARYSWTTIRVLPDLEGFRWGALTQAYLRALRPSVIRVVESGDSFTSDAITWRVTVYLDSAGCVSRIEHEVEVDLPDGVAHGYALEQRLEADAPDRGDPR